MRTGPFAFNPHSGNLSTTVEDAFGHQISYLRISITDRCNERCRYCMPEEDQIWQDRDEILTYPEILRIVSVGTSLGIHKIRITGGEPLTRPGVVDFCRDISDIPGIRDVGISTNGTLLSRESDGKTTAQRLVDAGVHTANISLDSLNPATYHATTRRDLLPSVLQGIDAAIEAGFRSIKLNCVLMKNQSEAELLPLIEFARQKGVLLRFIELMPVSTTDVLSDANFLSTGTARKLIEQSLGSLVPCPEFKTNGPASYFQVPGTNQKIGFIGAMTNLHFCESCNKLRLTADGKLRPCLGSFLEFDLLNPLRNGCTDAELRELFQNVVARKPKEHDFRNNYQPNRRMIAIGG